MQNAEMKEITLVDGDDWCGIYVDGRLVAEGHGFPYNKLLEFCGVKCSVLYPDLDWLSEEGNLPTDLKDVRLES